MNGMDWKRATLVLGMGAALCWGGNNAQGQGSDAILSDLLVRKGIVTDKEAADLKKEADADMGRLINRENKTKVATWIEEMRWANDLRDVNGIAVPPTTAPRQADGLWQHTCFEAFIGGQGSRVYCEFNFSPSTEWAAYGFSAYRAGMVPIDYTNPPLVTVSTTDDRIALEAVIPLEALLALPGDGTLLLGLAAVIEDQEGNLSYWALAHRAEKPDFHSPAGFVLEIERASTW